MTVVGKERSILSPSSPNLTFQTNFEGDTLSELVQKLTNQPTYSDQKITWCQNIYGNDASCLASFLTFQYALPSWTVLFDWGEPERAPH